MDCGIFEKSGENENQQGKIVVGWKTQGIQNPNQGVCQGDA